MLRSTKSDVQTGLKGLFPIVSDSGEEHRVRRTLLPERFPRLRHHRRRRQQSSDPQAPGNSLLILFWVCVKCMC